MSYTHHTEAGERPQGPLGESSQARRRPGYHLGVSSGRAATLERPPAPTAAPINRWAVLLAIGVGAYMSALDNSIVNAILPILVADFRTDVATVEWVVTTYLLVQS